MSDLRALSSLLASSISRWISKYFLLGPEAVRYGSDRPPCGMLRFRSIWFMHVRMLHSDSETTLAVDYDTEDCNRLSLISILSQIKTISSLVQIKCFYKGYAITTQQTLMCLCSICSEHTSQLRAIWMPHNSF